MATVGAVLIGQRKCHRLDYHHGPSARGADREDFPSEAGGTDEAFTRSTLSRSLALAQEPGGNTLLILEIVVMGASLTVAWDDRALPSRDGFVAAFAPDW